jgi:hypothetical protein
MNGIEWARGKAGGCKWDEVPLRTSGWTDDGREIYLRDSTFSLEAMMTKKNLILVCLAAFLLMGTTEIRAADDIFMTNGLSNGRQWRNLSQGMRAAYVLGYSEGARCTPSGDNRDGWPPGATFGEVEQALDRFFETPENRALPILVGVLVVRMKANGATPAELEKYEAVMRASSAAQTLRNTRPGP